MDSKTWTDMTENLTTEQLIQLLTIEVLQDELGKSLKTVLINALDIIDKELLNLGNSISKFMEMK